MKTLFSSIALCYLTYASAGISTLESRLEFILEPNHVTELSGDRLAPVLDGLLCLMRGLHNDLEFAGIDHQAQIHHFDITAINNDTAFSSNKAMLFAFAFAKKGVARITVLPRESETAPQVISLAVIKDERCVLAFLLKLTPVKS